MAGIGPGTLDPERAFIARDPAGWPTGLVQGRALEEVRTLLRQVPEDDLAADLAQASGRYAAHGLGTVRDPTVTPPDWRAYLRASAAGQLSVRSHAMIFSTPSGCRGRQIGDAYLGAMEEQGIKPGVGYGHARLLDRSSCATSAWKPRPWNCSTLTAPATAAS